MLKILQKLKSTVVGNPRTDSRLLNFDKWSDSLKLFEEQKYVESMQCLMEYICPSFADKLEVGKSFTIREGSVKIDLTLEGDRVKLRGSFLKHDGPLPIPLLRKLSDINMFMMNLAVIRVSDKELYFEHADFLELAHPHKMYGILSEMIYYSDLYDDLFVKKFNLKHAEDDAEFKKPRDNAEAQWEDFQSMIEETKSYKESFKDPKYQSFELDPFYSFYEKVLYFLNPEGYLKSLIMEALNELRTHSDFETKKRRAQKSFDQIANLEKADFLESVYDSDSFFSGKSFVSSEQIKGMINFPEFQGFHERRDYLVNAVYGEGLLYRILNAYHLNVRFSDMIEEAIGKLAKYDSLEKRSEFLVKFYGDLDRKCTEIDNYQAA